MHRYLWMSIAMGLICTCAEPPPQPAAQARDDTIRATPPREPACPPAAPDFGSQLAEAAEFVRAAVVSISPSDQARSGLAEGTPLAPLLRGLSVPSRSAEPRGAGSGVLVDKQGNILTNHHVVEGADSVGVQLADGRRFEAKVMGSDPKTDIAVIRLSPGVKDLHPATLGDSETLRVGEWVMACGNRLEQSRAISAGILSAIGRGSAGIAEYEDFIQTDAEVTLANSGGPLVDRKGHVIGINTTMAAHEGGSGGFAIPINMARKIMVQLIDTGRVVRGDIGAYVGYVTDELALSFGYRGNGGVLVQDVAADSPAGRAGLEPGDIILERGGKPVENATSFRNAIASSIPGTAVQLQVFRNGKRRDVEIQIGELQATASTAGTPSGSGQLVWGLEFSDVTPELQKRLALSTVDGAVIVQVHPNSPADDAGLRVGDLLSSVGDTEVLDADHVRRALLTAKAPVRLRIVHDGRGVFVMLRRGK
jgi:serine protease Do